VVTYLIRRLWVSDVDLIKWIEEDLGIMDLTTYLLGIDGRGVAELITREDIVVSCSEEAARIYELCGASKVEVLKHSGENASKGDVLIKVLGDAVSLHKAWRLAQNVLAICSGVSTKTHKLVSAAKKVNPKVVVVATRKTPPGLRSLYYKAVVAGGALPHRMGLSDTVLIFENHLAFLSNKLFNEVIGKIKSLAPFRKVGIEVNSIEDAIRAVKAGADMVQLERFKPSEVIKAIEVLKGIRKDVVIAVAGGIDEDNIEEYASTGVDLIVTSAPYKATPADITTRMKAISD